MASFADHMRHVFSGGRRDVDFNAAVLVAIGLIMVAAPLDLGQLAFAFVGALSYGVFQSWKKVANTRFKPSDKIRRSKLAGVDQYKPKPRVPKALVRGKSEVPPASRPQKREENPAGRPEYRQESSQPVVAPTFAANNFDAQVQELLCRIAPSPEGDKLVQDIAAAVQKALQTLIPEAEVMGFASGDVLRGTAFAVAIPEVDIILSANPSVFVERLQNRVARPIPYAARLDPRKLQKLMLRACTDDLTASPGFKFRRSAFKGLEPKVTLMADINGRSIPIDFSVNTITPLHNAALLTECGQIDPRAKELILLVRRWAKDRGVSHAAKGHLSPYAWSLLVIYFLQVWDGEVDPLLPNITSFKLSSGLLRKQHKERQADVTYSHSARTAAQQMPVATLFKEFIRFYAESFDVRNEAVSVRAGQRQPPAMAVPLTIVTLQNGTTDVAPTVEDPFVPKRNLSDSMTGVTLGRFREELVRAVDLCSQEASLSELIEPWVPPERDDSAAKAAIEHDSE